MQFTVEAKKEEDCVMCSANFYTYMYVFRTYV